MSCFTMVLTACITCYTGHNDLFAHRVLTSCTVFLRNKISCITKIY